MSIQNPIPLPSMSISPPNVRGSSTPSPTLHFGSATPVSSPPKAEKKGLLDSIEEFLEKYVAGFIDKVKALLGPANRILKAGQILVQEFQQLGNYSALVDASAKADNLGKTNPPKTDPSAYFNLFFNVFLAKAYGVLNQPAPPDAAKEPSPPPTDATTQKSAPSKALLGLYEEILAQHPGIAKVADGTVETKAEVKGLAKEIMDALAQNQGSAGKS